MENDKALKDLLSSGIPKASDAFAATIMSRIAAPLPVETPLVSPRLKRAFLFTFAAFSLLACGLALSMGMPRISFPSIDAGFLTGELVRKAVTFLLLFWLLVGFNLLWERNTKPSVA